MSCNYVFLWNLGKLTKTAEPEGVDDELILAYNKPLFLSVRLNKALKLAIITLTIMNDVQSRKKSC